MDYQSDSERRRRSGRGIRHWRSNLANHRNSDSAVASMQPKMTALCTLLMFVVVIAVSSLTADAIPRHESYWDQQDDIDRDEFLEILSRLSRINRPEMENNKRGLDLGLNRGYSGSQAAKHMMGLAAANYAGGPGRRRRSEQA
ncbi:PREDICTED: diuretic hormone class 2 [Acromyrmex echinatior]|uniref:diuretic hormone class 2 n=1 Tax=Acromyrmex echinatior TaxID=103372 RepID=UPI000580DF75|nr:PREDICTED: diuretic hormone class 2 [Acromyrmex echinatior]